MLLVGTLLLGSAILIQLNRPGAFPVDPFFYLIGLTYALSVAYFATLRFVNRHPWLADLQLSADALLVSGFIGLTGGIVSYFSSLYFLPIIAASTVRFRRGALQVATLSALLYLGLVMAQYVDMVPYWMATEGLELPTWRFAQYMVGINLFGFIAVALLAGSLAERLRSADARLAVASHQMADLRAYNEYVIDSLLSGLVTTDVEGRVLTFNKAAATITGVPIGQAAGQNVSEVLQLPPTVRAQLTTLAQTRSLRVDLEYRNGHGRLLDIGLMVTMIGFPGGRNGYLFTFQDVTELRRLERNARLQQRLAAVGEMAAGIAHEIRNPLASMSGSIQVLRQELPLTGDQAQLMDIVLRESERLNDTIRSFLAYARPQKFAVARLDVGKVVTDAALLLRNSSEARDTHTVDVQVPPRPGVVRGRRKPDPPDCLEHRDQRAASDAERRAPGAVGRDRPCDARRTRSCSASRTRGAASRPRSWTVSSSRTAARSSAAPGWVLRSFIGSSATTAASSRSRRRWASVRRSACGCRCIRLTPCRSRQRPPYRCARRRGESACRPAK